MSVTIVSPTVQEFRGVRYYLCGRYYQKCGQRLHRVVWQAHNGAIPRRAHIHHRDHNKHNNQPENLDCVRGEDHIAYHGRQRAGEFAVSLALHARPAAAEWHGSAEGKAWHREHWGKNCQNLYRSVRLACDQCGSEFETIDHGRNRFCSNACKSAWRRDQLIDDVERKCGGCGVAFFANRYTDGLYCSRKCYQQTESGKYQREVMVAQCHHCGVAFEAKDRRAIWCSNRCRRANDRRKAKGLQPLSGSG
jgi:hypothetical protein